METKFEIKFQITNPELVEIENWLKEELLKSNFGFYNNWNLIANAYSRNNIAILKDESNVIGLIIWSEYDRFVEIDIFEIRIEYRKKGIGRLFFNEI